MKQRTEEDYYVESKRIRKEDGNIFKPYAIIDEHTFNASISELQK